MTVYYSMNLDNLAIPVGETILVFQNVKDGISHVVRAPSNRQAFLEHYLKMEWWAFRGSYVSVETVAGIERNIVDEVFKLL